MICESRCVSFHRVTDDPTLRDLIEVLLDVFSMLLQIPGVLFDWVLNLPLRYVGYAILACVAAAIVWTLCVIVFFATRDFVRGLRGTPLPPPKKCPESYREKRIGQEVAYTPWRPYVLGQRLAGRRGSSDSPQKSHQCEDADRESS